MRCRNIHVSYNEGGDDMWLPVLKFMVKLTLEFGGTLIADLAAKKTAKKED